MGKGEGFEREVSRMLSLWWTQDMDHPRDDIFWRNRLRRTTKTPNTEAQLGDIKADDPIGAPLTELFNIELKTGYSANKSKHIPWDILDGIDYTERKQRKEEYQSKLMVFWTQCLRDSQISGRIPWLIFKRDYHVPVSVIKRSTFNNIEKWQGNYNAPNIIYKTNDNDLSLFRLEKFLDWLQPQTIRQLYEGRHAEIT